MKRRRVRGAGNPADAEDEPEDQATILVLDNHMWIFGPISRHTCLAFHTHMYQMSKLTPRTSIVMHLVTPGGCVVSALNMYDLIRSYIDTMSVEIIVEGEVASAGTLILLAASVRKIRANGLLLVHEVSCDMQGRHTMLKSEMQNLEDLNRRLIGVYKLHTHLTKKQITSLMVTETYLDAKTALKHGFVTEII